MNTSNSLFLILAIMSSTATKGLTQQCNSPFISSDLSCQPFKPVVSEVLKIYTSTLNVIMKNASASFDENIFNSAMVTSYNETLSGFKDLKSNDPIISSAGTFQVKYTTTYSFNVLNSTSTNEEIQSTIANISFIDAETQKDADFVNLYQIDVNKGLIFKENRVCDQVTCGGSSFTRCEESGLDVCCQSLCCAEDYCKNDGHCFHNDPITSPLCSCPVHANFWYVGSKCEIYLHLWMLIVSCLVFVFIVIYIIAFFVYKLFRLKEKSLNEIRNEKEERKMLKKSNNWKAKVKNAFSLPNKNISWLCCFGKKNEPAEITPKHENEPAESQSPPAATLNMSTITSSQQQNNTIPPKPLPRKFTNITGNSRPTTANTTYVEERGEVDDDESLHETTSQSSFDDDDNVSDHFGGNFDPRYDDVPDEEEDDIGVMEERDDQNYYCVPYDPEEDDHEDANGLPSTTRSSCELYQEPLVTTV